MEILLCGDVMTGRGVDQALPNPGDPTLWEPWIRDARRYVALAEEVNGPIPRPLAYDAPWGDALAEHERRAPDVFLANLETSITARGRPWPQKGIHYRMHPANLACIRAARFDVCTLANNHVLDFDREGLTDTLAALADIGVRVCGAGPDCDAAAAPAVVPVPGGRVLIFGACCVDSGVPPEWAATAGRSGVHLVSLDDRGADALAARIAAARRPGDVCVASLHFGDNWGFVVPDAHVRFARRLVDGGADLVHGHSSHHPRPLEVYRDRLVLYGCGDFLNDYEGISGHTAYRPDLTLLYAATLDPSGTLARLEMVPFRMQRFQLRRAPRVDARWLAETLTAACRPFGTRVSCGPDPRPELVLGSPSR